MAKQSSQKFIARNRAPRVQIEYDVETNNGQQKVEIPFVMGVMADLSGKSAADLPAVNDRKLMEIDSDNFDRRLNAMKPRVTFNVPNTLTGEGNLPVDITFESMDDFSPAAIAKKVEPLKKLLDARTQLSALLTRLDGKADAEKLLSEGIKSKALLEGLSGSGKSGDSN
jgi:type VI secretion system protein ImpB